MDFDDGPIPALASLNEPLRRRLYAYVTSQGAVSRDQAAAELGVARSVAAFHLDKLAQVGLLEVEYRRPPGRGGPGAGRPAKWYFRAGGEISLSVPERHYDLAAALLAQAVESATDESVPVAEALREVAGEYGRSIGARLHPSRRRSPRLLTDQLIELLADQGYEPRREGPAITMDNCPFHALAEQHRELVCGMNLELIRGALEVAGLDTETASLDPSSERCCVVLRP